MRVYVESNFVLECALLQEQRLACESLIAHAEAGEISLVFPAFSVAEPYHTLRRRSQDREVLSRDLDAELRQLGRSEGFAAEAATHRDLTAFLVRSGEKESNGLRDTLRRFASTTEFIPLDKTVLERAWQVEDDHGLTPTDAIVFASIVNDLERTTPAEALFLSRDAKDFNDPDILELLAARRCRLMFSFVDGLACLEARLRRGGS